MSAFTEPFDFMIDEFGVNYDDSSREGGFLEDDEAIARQLQDEYNKESRSSKDKQPGRDVKTSETRDIKSLIDPRWELTDPNPDIHELFLAFNAEYFWGRLNSVEVRWSPRMTLCAGVCVYSGNRSGYCSVRLSKPLLRLRPRKDLVETLLHELIHAYLFVTDNDTDHDGHGPNFLSHMRRINTAAGTKITVYHSFHDEVDHYRTHVWRCDGVCQQNKPYFGYVRRAMNRAPSPRDTWWGRHRAVCSGTFRKVAEPEAFTNKNKVKLNKIPVKTARKNKNKSTANNNKSLDGWITVGNKVSSNNNIQSVENEDEFCDEMLEVNEVTTDNKENVDEAKSFVPFSGRGFSLLGDSSAARNVLTSPVVNGNAQLGKGYNVGGGKGYSKWSQGVTEGHSLPGVVGTPPRVADPQDEFNWSPTTPSPVCVPSPPTRFSSISPIAFNTSSPIAPIRPDPFVTSQQSPSNNPFATSQQSPSNNPFATSQQSPSNNPFATSQQSPSNNPFATSQQSPSNNLLLSTTLDFNHSNNSFSTSYEPVASTSYAIHYDNEVACPSCRKPVPANDINSHLDACLINLQ